MDELIGREVDQSTRVEEIRNVDQGGFLSSS